MANSILHKYSATTGAVPAAGSMVSRELSINTADGRLFTKTAGGAVQEFARTGKGMTFGNVADAGATVLDWYEEGTVTTGLTLTASTTDPTGITYASRELKWTRIGNVVNFSLVLNISCTGYGSGYLKLNGLPYAAVIPSVSYAGRIAAGFMEPPDSAGMDNAGPYPPAIVFTNSQSYMRFAGNDFLSISSSTLAAAGGLFAVIGSGHYFVS